MGQRRRFTPEFKRQAVLLLNAGQRPAAEIARERKKLAKIETIRLAAFPSHFSGIAAFFLR